MKLIATIIKVIILVLIIIFASLNTQSVQVYYFFGKEPMQMPLFIVIILSFLLGMVIFWVISLKKNISKFIETNKLKSEINKLKNELKSIKSAPLDRENKR